MAGKAESNHVFVVQKRSITCVEVGNRIILFYVRGEKTPARRTRNTDDAMSATRTKDA